MKNLLKKESHFKKKFAIRRPLYLLTFIACVIIALVIVRIAIVNSIATTGLELVKMQNEISWYKKQNTLLKEQYLVYSSFTNIETKAKTLGFVDSKTHVYLSSPLPLALGQ